VSVLSTNSGVADNIVWIWLIPNNPARINRALSPLHRKILFFSKLQLELTKSEIIERKMNRYYCKKYTYKNIPPSLHKILDTAPYCLVHTYIPGDFFLGQGFPKSGPRATCGLPNHFCGPRSFLGFIQTYLNMKYLTSFSVQLQLGGYFLKNFASGAQNSDCISEKLGEGEHMWPAKYLPM
jgi:hypothetical protein